MIFFFWCLFLESQSRNNLPQKVWIENFLALKKESFFGSKRKVALKKNVIGGVDARLENREVKGTSART